MTEHIRDRNQVELHSTCSALPQQLGGPPRGCLYLGDAREHRARELAIRVNLGKQTRKDR